MKRRADGDWGGGKPSIAEVVPGLHRCVVWGWEGFLGPTYFYSSCENLEKLLAFLFQVKPTSFLCVFDTSSFSCSSPSSVLLGEE